MESRREALLFGKLAVRENLVTEEVADACMTIYDQQGETRTLGEIMAELMFITRLQLSVLQQKQEKWIGNCSKCNRSFKVLTTSKTHQANCPQCRGPLQEVQPN